MHRMNTRGPSSDAPNRIISMPTRARHACPETEDGIGPQPTPTMPRGQYCSFRATGHDRGWRGRGGRAPLSVTSGHVAEKASHHCAVDSGFSVPGVCFPFWDRTQLLASNRLRPVPGFQQELASDFLSPAAFPTSVFLTPVSNFHIRLTDFRI